MMRTEDMLIDACETLGFGVDINFLRGTVAINTGTGAPRSIRRFHSLDAALKFVQEYQARLSNF